MVHHGKHNCARNLVQIQQWCGEAVCKSWRWTDWIGQCSCSLLSCTPVMEIIAGHPAPPRYHLHVFAHYELHSRSHNLLLDAMEADVAAFLCFAGDIYLVTSLTCSHCKISILETEASTSLLDERCCRIWTVCQQWRIAPLIHVIIITDSLATLYCSIKHCWAIKRQPLCQISVTATVNTRFPAEQRIACGYLFRVMNTQMLGLEDQSAKKWALCRITQTKVPMHAVIRGEKRVKLPMFFDLASKFS